MTSRAGLGRAARAWAGLVLPLICLMTGVVAGPPSAALTMASAGQADPYLTESATTVRGSGRFADLAVTVGKTKHLSNEAIEVSWAWAGDDPGSHRTSPDGWFYNYLTIFQCWGDGQQPPTREQCQYGGKYYAGHGDNPPGADTLTPFGSTTTSRYAVSRMVSPLDPVSGAEVPQSRDPGEFAEGDGLYPSKPNSDPGQAKPGIVDLVAAPRAPGEKAKTTKLEGSPETSAVFDLWQTNEIPVAATSSEGTGKVFFQAQTGTESQFLGCGARVGTDAKGAPVGRSCWLVVVPRDKIDANGQDVTTRPTAEAFLWSSPLSVSNWAHRLEVKLDFDPIHEPCRVGGAERQVVGHESLNTAMSSWQGPLCSAGQGYFYANVTDDIARQSAASATPTLSVVTDPVTSPSRPTAGGNLVYAPIAVSGVSISFFFEKEYDLAPAEFKKYEGTRVEALRLTPRLVAKLLTQSYRLSGLTPAPDYLSASPETLLKDPEFIEVNRGLVGPDDVVHLTNANNDGAATLYVTSTSSDAVRLLWRYVLADPAARAFLAGKPDDYGMVVNKFYKGLSHYEGPAGPRASIPRLDGTCRQRRVTLESPEFPWCSIDQVPFVASLETAASLTAAGIPPNYAPINYDPALKALKTTKAGPQLVGHRMVMAITDTPSATRRSLISASLRNADGVFVAPTTDSMASAVGNAQPTSVPGVLRLDPAQARGTAYPLTRLEYAVTNPALLDAASRKAYASFVKTVTTVGQRVGSQPGDLPPGYAPLPKAMQTQAGVAAERIRTASPPGVLPPAQPTPSQPSQPGSGGPVTGSPGTSRDPSTYPSQSPAAGRPPAVTTPDPATPSAPAPGPTAAPAPEAPAVAAVKQVTAAIATTGWLLPSLLVLAVAAGAASRILLFRKPTGQHAKVSRDVR